MSFTGSAGGDHPNALWIVRSVAIDTLTGVGTYQIQGFHDQSYVTGLNPFLTLGRTFSTPPVPTNTSVQNLALIYQHEILDSFFSAGTLIP